MIQNKNFTQNQEREEQGRRDLYFSGYYSMIL